jgi:adenine-specific DNA-methyltransferase
MGRPGKKEDRLISGIDVSRDQASPDLIGLAARVVAGVTPEDSYLLAVPFGHRRRHAQFFTPVKIAKLMAEWALTDHSRNLLEPAVGMGVLVRAAQTRKPKIKITAFEKDPFILRAYLATQPQLDNIEVVLGDFLTVEIISQFDSVLMNPPYLRHHDLSYDFDIFSEFARAYGIEVSKLSNAYLLFTIKAVMALNPGGRASIIVPTEWMNANFGAAMKSFLVKRNFLKEIIYFSSCSEMFDDALTTACVLLIEREAS